MAEHRKITNLRPRIHAGATRTARPSEKAHVNVRGNSADPQVEFHIPQGQTGETPDLRIGNVRPVTDPAQAGARLRGTAENPILDLDLPRGLAAPDVAPTDQSVAALVNTAGTDTYDAVEQVAEHVAAVRSVDMVRGLGVRRIIATKDAEQETEDGDLLLLLDTPKFFTDFSSNAIGERPYDWTPRWRNDDGWEIYADETATAGRALMFDHSNTDRRALSWDLPSAHAADYPIVEVVFKWRPGVAGYASIRALTHGSGSAGSEWAYFAGNANSSAGHVRGSYTNGVDYTYTPSEMPIDPLPREWWITRVRMVEGDRIYVRSWLHTAPEPLYWDPVLISSDHPRGWIGLQNFSAAVALVDWVGVAYDGGRAPTGG